MLGLLFNRDDPALLVEFDDAESLRIIDVVAENGRPLLFLGFLLRFLQKAGEAMAIEDVVAQNHRAGFIADELFTQDEGLCQAIR